MELFSGYVVSIISVCIVISIIRNLTSGHHSDSIICVICGIVVTITVIAPLAKVRLSDISDQIDYVRTDADLLVQAGADQSQQQLRSIITDEIAAYILEKAETLGANLTVEVMLDDSSIPVPSGVRIRGNISPYNREKLSSIIQQDLGIPTEAQIWT